MINSNSVIEAQKLIDAVERLSLDSILFYEDVAPMISALGGKPDAIKDLQHGPSLFIYIAALMVRNNHKSSLNPNQGAAYTGCIICGHFTDHCGLPCPRVRPYS